MPINIDRFNSALILLNGRLALEDSPRIYHAQDLRALVPGDDEMLAAAAWARSQDPSEGFLRSLVWFLTEFGYGHIVERIQE